MTAAEQVGKIYWRALWALGLRLWLRFLLAHPRFRKPSTSPFKQEIKRMRAWERAAEHPVYLKLQSRQRRLVVSEKWDQHAISTHHLWCICSAYFGLKQSEDHIDESFVFWTIHLCNKRHVQNLTYSFKLQCPEHDFVVSVEQTGLYPLGSSIFALILMTFLIHNQAETFESQRNSSIARTLQKLLKGQNAKLNQGKNWSISVTYMIPLPRTYQTEALSYQSAENFIIAINVDEEPMGNHQKKVNDWTGGCRRKHCWVETKKEHERVQKQLKIEMKLAVSGSLLLVSKKLGINMVSKRNNW